MRLISAILAATGLCAITARAAENTSQPDITRMDMEDLMNVKVTSVSKKAQSLSRTAAAVFVINQEDIRRSGATNIPDLLRMAPGVDVEQINANAWAVSIRGFNSRYSNKVLVLIDGRTVYSPVFSGVFWEHLDMPLEDIDRIEVIRGPGASVWGVNAVNGVISIFTKSSKDTKGGLVTAGGGSQVNALGLLQYGGTAGNERTYRVYGKYFAMGNSALPDGSPAGDHWMREHAGFRSDWDLSSRDSLMLEGGLFANQAKQTVLSNLVAGPFDHSFNQAVDATGGDLLARWTHTLAGGSQTSFQAYYNSYRSNLGVPSLARIFDLDFQHHIAAGDRQDIVWGLGYRASTSGIPPGYPVKFSPPIETDNLFSAFVQDEIRVSDSLWFTIGGKVQHTSYEGVQPEPSVRLAWSPPRSRHTVWTAASKALRQPSRSDTDVQTDVQTVPISSNAIQVLRVFGNPRIKNEELRDYELGYRSELTKTLSLDIATFLSFYHHLETIEIQPLVVIPGSPLLFEIPLLYDNKAHAITYGGELALNWKPNSRWRISPGYSYLHATIRRDPSSNGLSEFMLATAFPQNMFQVRSSLNLSRRTEFDQSLYYTARLPGATIPGHARLDLRLARHFGESAEISLVGQNLLRSRSMEYGDVFGIVGAQSVRSVYGQIRWRF